MHGKLIRLQRLIHVVVLLMGPCNNEGLLNEFRRRIFGAGRIQEGFLV